MVTVPVKPFSKSAYKFFFFFWHIEDKISFRLLLFSFLSVPLETKLNKKTKTKEAKNAKVYKVVP